jgi:hypothetical protein
MEVFSQKRSLSYLVRKALDRCTISSRRAKASPINGTCHTRIQYLQTTCTAPVYHIFSKVDGSHKAPRTVVAQKAQTAASRYLSHNRRTYLSSAKHYIPWHLWK